MKGNGMNYSEYILLSLIDQVTLAESPPLNSSLLYHIVTGKNTSYQWVKLAELHVYSFFAVFPSLTQDVFNQQISRMERQGLISCNKQNGQKNNRDLIDITERGKRFLASYRRQWPMIRCDEQARYYNLKSIIMKSFVQVNQYISAYSADVKITEPYIMDEALQAFVRDFWIKYLSADRLQEYLTSLYRQLEVLPPLVADIFMASLVGRPETFNPTSEQLTTYFKVSSSYLEDIYWQLLVSLKQENQLISNLFAEAVKVFGIVPVTYQKSVDLYQRSYSLDKIATLRQLKASTIVEHLFLYSLLIPDFSFRNNHDPLLIKQTRQYIEQCQKSKKRLLFSDLKKRIGRDNLPYSYVLFARISLTGGVPWH
ncbi:MAG TPA: hypothetical protein DIW15_00730 [Bavariicoccus seileri]|uniref:Helicase Helix-turn-helix domain-containing protein n=2 Tax=Bavariicoccus seileri TaxID=549685 RepID=A0A3D4S3R5_9ENTE|nr:hypothetical protein [Bavariicoccus seileri]